MDSDHRDLTKKSYDSTAAEFHEKTAQLLQRTAARSFLSYLPARATILDLGCGPGRDALYFSDKGHHVIGVDNSPKMIELARARAKGALFILSDIETFDYQESAYDGVWASASLLHISKAMLPAVLNKIWKSLKPGGPFYFSMKEGRGERVEADQRYGGVEKFWNYVQEDELRELLTHFEILQWSVTTPPISYQTHPRIDIICRRE